MRARFLYPDAWELGAARLCVEALECDAELTARTQVRECKRAAARTLRRLRNVGASVGHAGLAL